MSEYTRFVGFDVSAATIAVAVAAPGRQPAEDAGTLPTDPAAVRKWVMRQADRAGVLVCYEAGPTGFGLYRQLTALGVTCQVVAPGLVPTRPTDRVKTDRRDARHLAEALRAGTLTPVRVPTEAEEAFRDLVRTRTMAVQGRHRARQRVKSTLLRWGSARPQASRPGAPRTRRGSARWPPPPPRGMWSGRNSRASWPTPTLGSTGSPARSRRRGRSTRWRRSSARCKRCAGLIGSRP